MTLITQHSSLITVLEAAHLESREGLPVVYLEGEPYELGRQHGELLTEQVRASISQLLGYFRRYLKLPFVSSFIVNSWLDNSWTEALPFIPKDSLEELRGLSDASGVPLRDLWRLHAIPERTYACSSLAVWGRATANGQLIHTRNLDWNIHAGIQRYAAIFVVHPRGKQAFVNVGWAGFIGVLTGINEQEISIGQIGAKTVEASYQGLPMTFLMRKVLEDAKDLDGAARLIQESPRTVGINYVVADAKARRAVAIETTKGAVAVFEADDPREHAVAYAKPIADAVFRADTAMDRTIRNRQLASGGHPSLAGIEPPTGSAYTIRYLGQAEGITRYYGKIDADVARAIAQSVAQGSNVQSVVFAWPRMWVANAQGTTPADRTPYHPFNLEDLFRKAP